MAFMINEGQYGDGSLIPRKYLDSALEIIRSVLLCFDKDSFDADFITGTLDH